MQVSYLTNSQMLPRVDVSSVYTVFDWFLDRESYVEGIESKRRNGNRLVVVGPRRTGFHADVEIAIRWGDVKNLSADVRGMIVGSVENYRRASENPDISVIAVLSERDPLWRPRFVKRIVESGEFCDGKEHWLYGVPNPAELGVYPLLFSRYVGSRFTVALCASCFLYSMYGAVLSRSTGVIREIPGCSDHTLEMGMSDMIDYDASREQIRVFLRNQEVVQDFSNGAVAPVFVDRARATIGEGV